GTYAYTNNNIYISSRIVQANNGKIISSCDFYLPILSADLRDMLRLYVPK
ncbi:MAG: hypothetical protein KKH68_01415, partial [Proteobacteria bacterium]|nr:hypothetical protein [Pseudomonadota bacterium]